jgi:VanZ family protein
VDPTPSGAESVAATPAESASAAPSLARAWTPVAIWIAIIFVMATDLFASGRTAWLLYYAVTWLFPEVGWEVVGPLHLYLRKVGHFVGYAVLGLLAYRAARETHVPAERWHARWAFTAVAVATVVACGDEVVQGFMTARGGSMLDVALDATGASFAQMLIWMKARRSGEFKAG